MHRLAWWLRLAPLELSILVTAIVLWLHLRSALVDASTVLATLIPLIAAARHMLGSRPKRQQAIDDSRVDEIQQSLVPAMSGFIVGD